MENENIYDKIQELFGGISGNYSILEEQIDIDLQMEYFNFSKKLNKSITAENILDRREQLFDDQLNNDQKKKLLVQLASLESVEAYRAIEKFVKEMPENLREWGILAMQESRMLLESKLLDENQVFISTGLGGKGNKLRYFLVLIKKGAGGFTEGQKKVISNEFDEILKKHDAEIEELKFDEGFGTITAIIPLNVSIKDIFKTSIAECNNYGNFLKINFIVTNVKKLTVAEIKQFILKNNPSLNEPED